MNYNPISADTLLGKLASESDKIFCENIANLLYDKGGVYEANVRIGDDNNSYIIKLITNYKCLYKFWSLNFLAVDNDILPNGKLYFLCTDSLQIDNIDYRYRYYIPETDEVFVFNNNFYGNLKISYRGLVANIAIKYNILTLHSTALSINNKNIIITGVSGAGKTTLLNNMIINHKAKLIWDDWGFISPFTACISNPNEIFNHLKIKSVMALLPDFKISDEMYTEFYDRLSPFYDEARIMLNISGLLRSLGDPIIFNNKLDTLIFITNYTDAPGFIKEIDSEFATSLFSTKFFSKAYNDYVSFFNGALFLDDELKGHYSDLYSEFVKRPIKLLQINNDYKHIDVKKLVDLATN